MSKYWPKHRITPQALLLAVAFVLASLFVSLGGCVVRTNAGVGHHKGGVRHAHRHCHNKIVKARDHRRGKRDHRKKKVCHSHPHGHPHH